MKQTTILINNRVDHVLNFEANETRNKTAALNSYIIENTGGKSLLFGFYPSGEDSEEFIYQTDEEKSVLYLSTLFVKDGQEVDGVKNCTMTINLSSENKDKSQNIEKPYFDKKHSYVTFNPKSDCCYKITVLVTVSDGEVKNEGETNNTSPRFSDSFVLFVVPKRNIYDLVLDYGSEASQMLIHHRSDVAMTINDVVPIFDYFKNAYGASEKEKNEEFLQYDADNDKFFRSLFFAKRNVDPRPDKTPYSGDFLTNEDYKIFCKVGDIDSIRTEYFTVPNVKIAGHGGVDIQQIRVKGISKNILSYGDNYFYRSFINAFMTQALRAINPGNDNDPIFLNVFMLMPNIYSQTELTRNLNYLANDLAELARNNEQFHFLKGTEVTSVSESDASFIGFMNQLPQNRRNEVGEGKYLILDAGKGTLDFSVVDYRTRLGNKSEILSYENIFRSGIIGAGNAITYSFAIAILKDIYNSKWTGDEAAIKKTISDYVKEKILSPTADEAKLNELMTQLEGYKILYNEGNLTNRQGLSNKYNINDIESFDKLDLQALINVIKMHYALEDDSWINDMITDITNKVINKLLESYGDDSNPDKKINYVVFAGRGFLMKKFKDKVLEALAKQYTGIKEIKLIDKNTQTAATFKNMCMFITHPLLAGKYNGRVVGIPDVISSIKSDESGEADSQEGGSDNEGKILDSIKDNKLLKKISDIDWKKQARSALSFIFPKSVSDDDDMYYGNQSQAYDSLNKLMVEGKNVRIDATSSIVLSGLIYDCPCPSGSADIFFNGREFIIRQEGLCYNFGGFVDLSGQHVVESTFPYCTIKNNTSIPFPHHSDNKTVSEQDKKKAEKKDKDEKKNEYDKDNELLKDYEV